MQTNFGLDLEEPETEFILESKSNARRIFSLISCLSEPSFVTLTAASVAGYPMGKVVNCPWRTV